MANYNKIIEFLDQYFEEHGVITEGDDPKLEEFMRGLGAKVDQLSLTPENGGDKLILYSGRHGENMWRYADAASQSGQGYYYISNTEAGRLHILSAQHGSYDRIFPLRITIKKGIIK